MLEKQQKRYKRHKRVRAKVFGTSKIPRLSVFRSAKHIYAQLIDDEKGKTLVSASDKELGTRKVSPSKSKKIKKEEKEIRSRKVAVAFEVGKTIAKKALDLPAGRQGKKIEKIIFDRGGYKYHGRVKAVAEGAREEGLKF